MFDLKGKLKNGFPRLMFLIRKKKLIKVQQRQRDYFVGYLMKNRAVRGRGHGCVLAFSLAKRNRRQICPNNQSNFRSVQATD